MNIILAITALIAGGALGYTWGMLVHAVTEEGGIVTPPKQVSPADKRVKPALKCVKTPGKGKYFVPEWTWAIVEQDITFLNGIQDRTSTKKVGDSAGLREGCTVEIIGSLKSGEILCKYHRLTKNSCGSEAPNGCIISLNKKAVVTWNVQFQENMNKKQKRSEEVASLLREDTPGKAPE